jgi:hypothetical protein
MKPLINNDKSITEKKDKKYAQVSDDERKDLFDFGQFSNKYCYSLICTSKTQLIISENFKPLLVDRSIGIVAKLTKENKINVRDESLLLQLIISQSDTVLSLAKHYSDNPLKFVDILLRYYRSSISR